MPHGLRSPVDIATMHQRAATCDEGGMLRRNPKATRGGGGGPNGESDPPPTLPERNLCALRKTQIPKKFFSVAIHLPGLKAPLWYDGRTRNHEGEEMRSAAQLTEYGEWQRMWGDFPALGRALGDAPVPSVGFDEIERLMTISILVRENLALLRRPEQGPTNETEREAQERSAGELHRDLANLTEALEWVARRFQAEAEEVTDARRSLTD